MRLLPDAQSEFEIRVIAGAIRRDCKFLKIATPVDLARKMGCSTSTAYARMRDGSLEAAIIAVAATKQVTLEEARQLKGLKLDIRRATNGTVFDSPAWHREIERLFASLRYEIVNTLARETTLSRFDAQKGSDRALMMIPQSRIEKLDELGLLAPEICRMLGLMSEHDRDAWIADRDAEDLAELCGNADQRRRASSRYGSQGYEKRIKAYLAKEGRSPKGPVLPKPNVPPSLAEITKRKSPIKKKAA
ncbi:hypothetical protein AXW67_00505 [Bradyrhizobium neotropicale]|uniref:Uncharacterized protein n=2 Tax=Bradyrhizobium neotropicale TaxID=1497615 RepID=A0A176Z123_9BRAD|nr:hypothetical protein AXW67_00505 [Bradyrhizobium neotropicale]